MPHFRKDCSTKEKKARRTLGNRLDNVISIRISDQEKRNLERLIKRSSKSVSEVMREALELWSYKQRALFSE
ncbi:CopG family transcriptional regulator [Geobacter sulfurreducens]|uniref:Transcriptional repressor, HgtR-related protein n=1 Tax=Geobacter sulfurreducens (strain ATCC 51573 / DSM 12127 / PCA) TaxID=243231 RepID=Q74CV2_GEOSL|nr:ribbon-helix-helix protein, CopG family [Geobacter sulfurreducens]AAR34943.1 transcriptional repressor, HgtR-related protein [Geobacter sulfurreducens PCA]ADI84404.1 transcriptional repressor, HgtR-related [Geobacter sulfurreducens KN400]AJY71549.1 CopG family transcriptional regulator [Geobacter sulfurreducens]QVW36737.1 CopG family transcriptional regulator [Geobacter sulfurreducens]UAC05574.1 ribbon-helix-helix protein, CopG family [Geobacter sulfurreducens]